MLSGQTDMLGNVSVLARLMSSKFPLVVIMTELTERLKQWDLDMNLDWIPRNQNEEADGLTNGIVNSFAAELEIKVDLKKMGLHTLDRMLKVADELYKDVQNEKVLKQAKVVTEAGRATAMSSPRSKLRPPREEKGRNPW